VARNKVHVTEIAANITLAGFYDWCTEHHTVPEDPNKASKLKYDVNFAESKFDRMWVNIWSVRVLL
jgi:hypothetical protein